jgi:hypothetical protein
MESSKEFKTPVQALGHATAAMLLNDLLRNNFSTVSIFATAVMMLEYALIHRKTDRGTKLKSVDNVRAKLREAIEANCSEVSDEDLEEFRRHLSN